MPNKSNFLSYNLMHYHCRPGGVRTVMENSCLALIRYGDYDKINITFIGDVSSYEKYIGTFEIGRYDIKNIDLNEMNYSSKPYKNKYELMDEADKLAQKIISSIDLEKASFENPLILHAHNMNLGKSPLVSASFYLFAEWAVGKPVLIISQVHDFAENGRYDLLKNMQNCTGEFDNDFAVKMMYPRFKSIVYAAINPGDVQNLIDLGISINRVFLLPNSIDVGKFKQKSLDKMDSDELKKLGLEKTDFGSQLKKRIKEFSDKEGFTFDVKKKIILAPLKCMRRKNIAESILLLKILGDEYQLLVTLDPTSGEDVKYSNKIKKFAKKNKLNVVIGVGKTTVSSMAERVIVDGKVILFNMDDLYEISEAVVTTSLVEGFGFVYHEGWLTDKFVFGRKIPYVTQAYEKNGMDLSHMYTNLKIDPAWVNLNKMRKQYYKKQVSLRENQKFIKEEAYDFNTRFYDKKMPDSYIDFGDLDLDAQIKLLKNFEKYKKEVINLNPGLNELLKIKKGLISNNKKKCSNNYSFEAKAKNLKNIFDKGKKLIREDIKNTCKLDNKQIITKYIELENLRLLI